MRTGSQWNAGNDSAAWFRRGTEPFSVARLFRSLADAGLAAVILVAPFFMSGRQPLGQAVLCALAVFTLVCWAMSQVLARDGQVRFSGAEPLILVALALIVLQVVPLQEEHLRAISPRIPELLSLWNDPAEVGFQGGTWSTVSLAPAESVSNLAVIVACVMVYFVAVQRLQGLDDVRLLFQVLSVAAVAMAAFGIVQLATTNGKFFWFYEEPFTDTRYVAKGAFTNANHFADFLAMTVPIQLWGLIDEFRGRPKRKSSSRGPSGWRRTDGNRSVTLTMQLRGAGLVVTGLAIMLSMSRAGILVGLGGGTLTLLLLAAKRAVTSGLTFIVGGLAAASLVGTLLFGDLAARMVEQNFVELSSAEVDTLDRGNSRRKIWEANIAGMREFPVLGTGLGSHQEVYWTWFNHPETGRAYSHAENGYLQIGLETGLAGLAVLLLLWLLVLKWCVAGLFRAKDAARSGPLAAVLGGLAVSLLHSTVDFVWYDPACVNVVLLLAAAACALNRATKHADVPARSETGSGTALPAATGWLRPARMAWAISLPAILFTAGWVWSVKAPELRTEAATDEYLRLVFAEQKPKDEFGSASTNLERRQEMAFRSVEINPRSHAVQMRAAASYLQKFMVEQEQSSNAMPLSQIRLAAADSGFESFDQLNQWLNKPGVLGDRREYLTRAAYHFREALRLCPLQSRAYLELAQLVWLEGAPPKLSERLIEQAATVRPYDARSLFAMGELARSSGDLKRCLDLWKEAFRLDADYREGIIRGFAAFFPARLFLEQFHPDLEALRQMREAYRESLDPQNYRDVLRALAIADIKEALSDSSVTAERNWLEAHECFRELGENEKAYRAAMEAIRANPNSYSARLKLGVWLYESGEFAAASEHLVWCHRRQPDLGWLRKFAERAMVEGEKQQSRPQRTAAGHEGPVR